VPCLILSPFTRGGFVCSPYYTDTEGNVRIDPAGTFDHTSINRFIARVFGAQGYDVTVPNLSAWRQSITGDFSVAFPRVFDTTVPRLPTPTTTDVEAAAAGVINGLAGTEHYAPQPYPPPTNNGTFPPPQDGRPLHHTYSPSD